MAGNPRPEAFTDAEWAVIEDQAGHHATGSILRAEREGRPVRSLLPDGYPADKPDDARRFVVDVSGVPGEVTDLNVRTAIGHAVSALHDGAVAVGVTVTGPS